MKVARILVIISVACLLTTVSVFGQASVNFANNSATRIYVGLGGNHDSFVPVGTASTAAFGLGPASVEVRLFAGTTSSFLSPVLIGPNADQQFVLNTSSLVANFQGLFSGGNPLALPGFDGSSPVFFQMTLSATPSVGPFSGVHAQSYSPIIQVTPLIGPELPKPLFGPPDTPNAWDALDWSDLGTGPGALTLRIGLVPEPSGLALTASSFALMLLGRRGCRQG